jgi:hypothetical protein
MKKLVLYLSALSVGLLFAGCGKPPEKESSAPVNSNMTSATGPAREPPHPEASQKATPRIAVTIFHDEPAAHALYNQMIDAMRKADSLSYVSHYTLEWKGEVRGDCTYRAWLKKPNYFRVETESAQKGKEGVLVGDGSTFWIYWPQGRSGSDYRTTAARSPGSTSGRPTDRPAARRCVISKNSTRSTRARALWSSGSTLRTTRR